MTASLSERPHVAGGHVQVESRRRKTISLEND